MCVLEKFINVLIILFRVQENIQVIEDTLNRQMLNIIGNENYVDASSYIEVNQPIVTADELVNTLSGVSPLHVEPEKPIEENPFLYHQVIVNINPENEQMPIFDNNGIENIVSQLKLQVNVSIGIFNLIFSNNICLIVICLYAPLSKIIYY